MENLCYQLILMVSLQWKENVDVNQHSTVPVNYLNFEHFSIEPVDQINSA